MSGKRAKAIRRALIAELAGKYDWFRRVQLPSGAIITGWRAEYRHRKSTWTRERRVHEVKPL